MTIALVESLLDRDGLDDDHLAATLATTDARDPRCGYGAGNARLLRRLAHSPATWRTEAAGLFDGSGSWGDDTQPMVVSAPSPRAFRPLDRNLLVQERTLLARGLRAALSVAAPLVGLAVLERRDLRFP